MTQDQLKQAVAQAAVDFILPKLDDKSIVGVGTVLYALLIGPVVQLFLPMLTVRVERPAPRGAQPEPAATEPAAG